MTILVTIDCAGDVEDLLAKYDQALPTITADGLAAGMLLHLCAANPDGFTITEVWPGRDELLAYVQSSLEPTMRGLGMPSPTVVVRPIRTAVPSA